MNEEQDLALYDIVGSIWEAYRECSKSGDASFFNYAFEPLFRKYKDAKVQEFIRDYGGAFIPFVNERCNLHERLN